MNQRLEELARQAGLESFYVEYSPWQVEFEKFAELIVKECISVPYAMWDQAELNADVAVKIEHRIRDHFGMEE